MSLHLKTEVDIVSTIKNILSCLGWLGKMWWITHCLLSSHTNWYPLLLLISDLCYFSFHFLGQSKSRDHIEDEWSEEVQYYHVSRRERAWNSWWTALMFINGYYNCFILLYFLSRKVEMNFDTGIGKGKPDAEFSPVYSFPMYDKTSL